MARGESYSCGYKPYRCEICNYSTTTKGNLSIHMQSDKHLNNMQDLSSAQTIAAVTESNIDSEKKLNMDKITRQQYPIYSNTEKSSYRCDVCNYETIVARNLKIHMTSEKHLQNVANIQNNIKHIQAIALLHQRPIIDIQNIMSKRNRIQLFEQSTQIPLFNNITDMQLPKQHSSICESESILSKKYLPSKSYFISSQFSPYLLYSCITCLNYCTNSLKNLNDHISFDRSHKKEADNVIVPKLQKHKNMSSSTSKKHVDKVLNIQFDCHLCAYKTWSPAHFHLHSKTFKHLQRKSIFNHFLESENSTESKINYYFSKDFLRYKDVSQFQLKCNCCDYYTDSIKKLYQHTQTSKHYILCKIFKIVSSVIQQTPTNSIKEMIKECKQEHFKEYDIICNICNKKGNTLRGMISHAKTLRHIQLEKIFYLQNYTEPQKLLPDIFSIKKNKVSNSLDDNDNKCGTSGK